MWTAPVIVATAIAAFSLMWAVASTFMARGAQRSADQANIRAAAALERANELTEQLMNPPAPWTLELSPQPMVWNLRNATGHHARDVFYDSTDEAFREVDATTDIEPDGVWQLQATRAFRTATITVRWTDAADLQQEYPITVVPA